MATLQQRNGSYRVLFNWARKKHSFTMGTVPAQEAEGKAAQVDYLLMRLKQGLLTVPDGVSIADFVAFDGKPPLPVTPAEPEVAQPETVEVTLDKLRTKYVASHKASLEASSVGTIGIHFGHLVRILGEGAKLREIGLAQLQDYVDKRAAAKGRRGKLSPETIRKELVSFRAAWNWAIEMGIVSHRFPNQGLRFPKGTEKPPFMTFEEIVRQTTDPDDELWESLYLRVEEISELLAYVKAKPAQPFVFPMAAFAAHTGARRSEIIRTKITDVDLDNGQVTLHERKRDHARITTRRVPLSPFLARVLREWLGQHPGGLYLFCQFPNVQRSKSKGRKPAALTKDEFHDHFQRALRGSKWEVLKGAHALRHSFISALASKGVDQRMIDEFVGHMSEQQRRRYRHLYPNVKREAMVSVFGESSDLTGFQMAVVAEN